MVGLLKCKPFTILLLVVLISMPVYLTVQTLVPIYLGGFSSDPAYDSSVILGSIYATMVLSSVLGGIACDALGIKRTLVLGLSAYPIFSFMVFHVHSRILLVLLGAYLGFSAGLFWPGVWSYLLYITPVMQKGLASGLLYMGIQWVTGLTTLLLARTVDLWGFQILSALGGLMLVTSWVITVVWLPRVPSRSGSAQLTLGRAVRSYAGFLRHFPFARLVWAYLLAFTFAGVGTVSVPLLVLEVGGSTTSVGIFRLVSAVWLGIAFGIWGKISDIMGRKVPLVFGLCLAAVASALIGISSRIMVLYVLAGLVSIGFGAVQPIALAGIGDWIGDDERGIGTGLLNTATGVAMLAGLGITGAFGPINIRIPLFFCTAFFLLAAGLVLGMRGW